MAMNRPIESENKSSRLDMGELVYQNCWAFMRELRTHNKTKRIYPVDPYAEVYQYRDNMYAIFLESTGGGDAWSYLIIGPEKAMLIDTGFGLGDLKGLVDEITGGMPLIVANTHPHGDHVGGNSQFERVYILEDDAVDLRRVMTAPQNPARTFHPDGSPRFLRFDKTDLIPRREYEIVPVPDGYVFDLGGGYEIETIQLAGHAKGQAAFLDKTGRCLYCGDDIIGMRVSVYGSMAVIRDFRDRMARLAARAGEFDGIFPGHFVLDLENICPQLMVDALDRIIADPEDYDYVEERGNHGTTYCKAVVGLGSIGYNRECFGQEEPGPVTSQPAGGK